VSSIVYVYRLSQPWRVLSTERNAKNSGRALEFMAALFADRRVMK